MIFQDSSFFDFEMLRIVAAFSMLFIATYFDIKKREVHDFLWIAFGALAAIMFFREIDNISFLMDFGLSIAIIIPIGFIVWKIGVFGGADAFAIMVLAALAPFANLSDSEVTPLSTLTNAGFLALSMLMFNALRNLKALLVKEDIFYGFDEPRSRKVIAFFIGTKAKNPRYSFSIQKWDGSSKRWDFSLHQAEHAQFCTTPFTWVTPGMPFLFYITLGFCVQVFFGDILFFFLRVISIS